MSNVTMQQLVAFCKNRGFVFPGSEIYGGLANTWDYGPLGVELKNNLKREWWDYFVTKDENSYGVDCAILMNPRVWEASGHVAGFSDPKMDCKHCKTRHRADTLIEEYNRKHDISMPVDTMSHEEMSAYIAEKQIKCPDCGAMDWTPIKNFNLMFQTRRGTTEENSDIIYLRPETCQGEYVNFLNVQRTMRAKIPFGIGQIGKSFRNEITPGNFVFRTIEFEQMEYQLFCKPGDDERCFNLYKEKVMEFYKSLGLPAEKLKFKDHDKLAFYAKAATDIVFNFPFGWEELNGIHNRTNYDLSRHQEYSGKNLNYTDPITNEKYIPYIVEFSVGADRLFLTIIADAYTEETLDNGETRIVLKLLPKLAPYKVAVLPLQKNLSEKALDVFHQLRKEFNADYDESGSIGKRYRRHDEIGTPYCVTIDFDTLENDTVTIRDRDTMEQERIAISDLTSYLNKKIYNR